jgi:hypothetical protein
MKTPVSIVSVLVVSATILAAQEPPAKSPAPASRPPTPVSAGSLATSAGGPVYVYDQKPRGGRSYLVTTEQAQAVIGKFKEAYAKAGSPRVLIYVNRELVDDVSGLKLSARTEHVETSRATGAAANEGANTVQKATHKNTYRIHDRKDVALADRQTMRDVERLFARPLRMAGATIVDQRVATHMLPGKSLDNLITNVDSEQTRREREAISKVADLVLEVLISSRNMTVPEISGERVITVPDIQATAIRLSDSKILGQSTAADLLNRVGGSARHYDVREVTEATALSLMEDMTL